VTNAVLHPWLKEQLRVVLAASETKDLQAELPAEAERPACARWETWMGHPPLRRVLDLDTLAGHQSSDLGGLVV
jgi:hypothetical protein